jgi:hypothetical protein
MFFLISKLEFDNNLSGVLDKHLTDGYNVIESATKPENRDDVTETLRE